MMRYVSMLFLAICFWSLTAGVAVATEEGAKKTEGVSSAEAWKKLEEGNARFAAGQSRARNLPAEVRATAGGQYPFGVVLSCLDSRVPVELIFDQGIGDLFIEFKGARTIHHFVMTALDN